MPEKGKLEHTALCCVLLALVTLAVYLPVIELRFVTFDDSLYVTENPKVRPGLTWDGIWWAFTCAHGANWHPLTWLSHMLDCELYGLKPAGHHFTNLLFHTANTLLLFGLLRRLTGAFWRSALVAALFALHPLHVESVAWVAERKDLLSTFFLMLTLGAYDRYTESLMQKVGGRGRKAAAGGRQAQGSQQTRQAAATLPALQLTHHAPRTTYYASLFYALSLLCFALGLMCKPMLVTLPLVLLLLDYWPLGRLSSSSRHGSSTPSIRYPTTPTLRLLLEKLPFFVLSAASCVTTLIVQWQGGAVVPFARELGMSLESRLMSTPVAYAWYLMKVIWPSDLAVIYPSVREWSLGWVLLATVSLLALTGAAVWQRQRRPYVLVGWLWYLGTLVPVIGLIKVGGHFVADRYMYIPSIGLFVVLAWGLADLTASWAGRGLPLAVGAATVLVAFALATGKQLLYWQNTETLFRRALAVTRSNYIACDSLGFWFAQHGQLELAKRYYRLAMNIAPDYIGARNHLGWTLIRQNKYEDAILVFEDLLRLKPDFAEARRRLALALAGLDRTSEAIEHLRAAVRLEPENVQMHYELGNVLLQNDQPAEAASAFRLAASLNPRYAEAHCQLAAALAGQKKIREAVRHYRTALELAPDLPEALNNLAWILAANPDPQVRNGPEAVALAERACQLSEYERPIMVGTLAAAYAEAGRFAEAVAAAEKAKALAEQAKQADLVARNGALLERYRA